MDDEPAFPGHGFSVSGSAGRAAAPGMTKREYIAALVLAGISSSQSDSDAVETAVERADKLLKELEKKTK